MLTAISGGIGSGKSVVARMLISMGYDVYDCDSRARRLIDDNIHIRETIAARLGQSCITPDGSLNRKIVGDIVFNNPDKLKQLNAITHAAVRADIECWSEERKGKLLFVETAILYQSEIDRMVDAVIDVTAPVDIRIERVMRRNGLAYDDVLARINAQNFIVENPHPRIYTILNDGIQAVLPQLQSVLEDLCKDCKCD